MDLAHTKVSRFERASGGTISLEKVYLPLVACDGRQDLGVDVVHRCFPEGGDSISNSLLLGVLASEAKKFTC